MSHSEALDDGRLAGRLLGAHAATDLTARRLTAQLRACEAAALAFCRLLERWNRGDAQPATAGQRAGRAASRRGPGGDGDRRARGTALPLSARARAGARRGAFVVPGPGAGELVEWRPVLDRAGVARLPGSRRLGLSRARGARPRAEGLADSARSTCDARPLVALGGSLRPARHVARRRRSTTCARSLRISPTAAASAARRRTPHRRRRFDQPRPRGARERLPRPGETVTGADFTASRAARARTRRSPRAARRRGDADRAPSGATRSPTRRLPALREAGVELRLQRVDGPTGVALITVDADGRDDDHRRPGRERTLADDVDVPARRRRAVSARDPGRGRRLRVAAGVGDLLPQRRAGPADRGRRRPRRRQPLRARDARCVATGSWRSRSAPRARCCSRTGEEVARATPPVVDGSRRHRRRRRLHGCLLVSLLEGRDREEALRRACAAGALAASRLGAQPSLPTAAEVDEILGA